MEPPANGLGGVSFQGDDLDDLGDQKDLGVSYLPNMAHQTIGSGNVSHVPSSMRKSSSIDSKCAETVAPQTASLMITAPAWPLPRPSPHQKWLSPAQVG